ncbi:hypothetical protein N7463_010829 [Penicillium fimorum]|uniref:Uncharacterized protein n=1 Tax=Penicillium fimorum TaxID=1882269 RepID=A0A9W9XKK4_9EURO|nr:hypothetical protein N7463_010829 [Penicillium fimorum]
MASLQTPAQSHTLCIPEIFELILLNLNSNLPHWSHFINSSPRIQWTLDNALNKPKAQNPLLGEAFPSIFHRPGSSNRGSTKNNDTDVDTANEETTSNLTFTTFDMVRNQHKWDTYIRPEANWRRILV